MDFRTISSLSREQKLELVDRLETKLNRSQLRGNDTYFPETGPLRRELYAKHMEFFANGATHEERCALGANRVGKTETIGGYEMVLHLTGEYPPWWNGRRFENPIDAWCAGKTSQTTRDIIQLKLLGPIHNIGSGLLKKELIHDWSPRRGIPDCVETIIVKHKSGGLSTLGFKSYDQGRQSFEGTKKDVIWLDEECPLPIYSECLMRTTDTSGVEGALSGLLMLTFTPLLGMSEVVLQFLPNGEIIERKQGAKAVTMITWDDVPHLSKSVKEKLLESIPPFQRDARTKGVPQLGAGAIYPVPETEITVDDFKIPDHWPRMYILDVGWNRTAAIWLAKNPEDGVTYGFSEHYQGQAEPIIHATAIKSRGVWIPGEIDPAARGRSQKDGEQLMQNYIDLGLDIEKGNNSVEAGLYETWQMFSMGKLKIFRSLRNFFQEYRLYRRDEHGHIVKKNDHLMDCLRMGVNGKMERAKVKPFVTREEIYVTSDSLESEWMG